MKNTIFTTVLSSALLLAACNKDDSNLFENDSIRISGDTTAVSNTPAAWASGWETGSGWTHSDSSGFRLSSYTRSLPAINAGVLQQGVVMVWAKNFEVDPAVIDPNQPQMMPFYLFPDNERPKHSEYWDYVANEGSVTLRYRTNSQAVLNGTAGPSSKVSYRFLVIPVEALEKQGLDKDDLSLMNYQQIVSTFGFKE